MNNIVTFFIIECLCVVGVLADYYLKLAGSGTKFVQTSYFFAGMFFYALTAFGWFFVLKYVKLVQIGVIYSVSIVLMLALTGAIMFDEKITPKELLGIVLAIISLSLMSRFS